MQMQQRNQYVILSCRLVLSAFAHFDKNYKDTHKIKLPTKYLICKILFPDTDFLNLIDEYILIQFIVIYLLSILPLKLILSV